MVPGDHEVFGLGERLFSVYNFSPWQFYDPLPDEWETILLDNADATAEGKVFLHPEFHNG